MGRELKRVPLDFEWPLKQKWSGYINSLARVATECPHCGGTGFSPEARKLSAQWYGNAPFKPEDRGSVPFKPTDPAILAMVNRNMWNAPEYYGKGEFHIAREARRLCDLFNGAWSHHLNEGDIAALMDADRLWDFTHTWDPVEHWKPKVPAYIPTPAEVNLWSITGFGHDCSNQWICVEAECKRLGFSRDCTHCAGEGNVWTSPEAKLASEQWERTEPPVGEGYQMWETVSEGSPISPVFATPEELASWLAENRAGTVDEGMSAETWLKFIKETGWAPSFVSGPEGFQDGVRASVN